MSGYGMGGGGGSSSGGGVMRQRSTGSQDNRRSSGGGKGSFGGASRGDQRDDMDELGAFPIQDEMLEDDNAAPEMASENEADAGAENPLDMAIDDLLGRIIDAADQFKQHPGVRSSSTPGSPSIHEELGIVLRPILEVAAHTGPSVARTYCDPTELGVEMSCDEVYRRVIADVVLPVILEVAQTDTIPAKRAASLEFFHNLWKEFHKGGSWLDSTVVGQNAGPYGSGGTTLAVPPSMTAPGMKAMQNRRKAKRMDIESELLRYWVSGANFCMVQGVFTSEASEGAVASRGVIAASAILRPSLRHIAQRIQDADDRGAVKLYSPVMQMIEGVAKKLFVMTSSEAGDALRSACIKFMEIVVLTCSVKGQPGAQGTSSRRRGAGTRNTADFSLEDLPKGHPIITREALESIGEYAFTTLRGLVLIGGQVKIDVNVLSDMMLSGGGDNSPSSQVVSILKPAALAFLEVELSVSQDNRPDEAALEFNINREDIDLDFVLSHKSYAISINAVAMLATHRPIYYKKAATVLSRRAFDPPKYIDGGALTQSAVIAIGSQLKSSCLTLLRNVLSVTTNGYEILHKALCSLDMTQQADKALNMAKKEEKLKSAGRNERNRAAMFYEWDASGSEKRQQETADALAKMKLAKAARGLGSGIQLPTSMVDQVELIMLNMSHLPSARPKSAAPKSRKQPITLDYVIDAIMTNGASLSQDEGRWYQRDGGTAWVVDDAAEKERYTLDPTTLEVAKGLHSTTTGKGAESKSLKEKRATFQTQCQTASSHAFGRLVKNSLSARSEALTDFGNQISARLAWTLKGVQPSSELQMAHGIAMDSVNSMIKRKETAADESLQKFAVSYPLVSSCLALDVTPTISNTTTSVGAQPSAGGASKTDSMSTLCNRVLNEAYMQDCVEDGGASKDNYDKTLDVFVSSVVHASERANEKPNDNDKKRAATLSASSLPHQLAVLPSVTPSSLSIVSANCDLAEITKKAAEAARKSSQQTLADSASAHAAKVAAEKRATSALLALRDVAFQRSKSDVRRSAVSCAVAIAAGRLPASAGIEEKALKLVMNVLFTKSESLADDVVESATAELERASDYAVEQYDTIQKANKESKIDQTKQGPFSPLSDEEKEAMNRVRKPVVLFMALSVRRPEMIKKLMVFSCKEHADVLSKAARQNMPKLTRAAATKYGAEKIALQVEEMATNDETPMLLAFLDNLAPKGDKNLPSQELIEAMHDIQKKRADSEGKMDPRFIIPVVSAMKRAELIPKLAEFVVADNDVFMAGLIHMNDRVGRQALIYRDEPDPETPSLHGMTLCEQLVFLHKLDFTKLGLPQKRYLDAIRLCLEEDEVFTDRVIMAALDYISGTFLEGGDDAKLPLAYMRTIILTCSKHESLHPWICHTLLPRLIEGKVYSDRRQWEGWMRCAKMLENTGDSGVSSLEAIEQLPEEQLAMYKAKYQNR